MRWRLIIACAWVAAGLLAVAFMLARAAGHVRIGDDPTVLWSDSAHEQVQVPLPDSLRLLIEAGQVDSLDIVKLPNAGWSFIYGDTSLVLPIHRGAVDLWPSPDGWVEHWLVERTYWIAVRCQPDTTVVALWKPSWSPSY